MNKRIAKKIIDTVERVEHTTGNQDDVPYTLKQIYKADDRMRRLKLEF